MSSDSYSQQKTLESFISSTSSTPAVVSATSLESLKLLDFFYRNKDSMDGNLKAIFEEESQYLQSAMNAINTDPILQMKFGKTFESVINLTGIMKAMDAEKKTKEIIFNYLPQNAPSLNKKALVENP
jgi:hypothetical protein